jgi:diaminopimelate epimerase
MKFTKLQGCGNDYLFVDLFREKRPADAAALARAMADRRFGVGADGLILVAPAEGADVAMEMYNADGSRGRMCGNGVRGLAKLAYERGIVKGTEMRVRTDSGVLPITVEVRDGKVVAAKVRMGAPSLNRGDLPMNGPAGTAIEARLKAGGRELVGTAVSMGNPHFVVFLDDGTDLDAYPVAEIGPHVETHHLFPERVNTEFVQVVGPNEVRQRTWERGSGETLACGTGASAVCVAGMVTGRTKSPLLVHLRGGDLVIEWGGKGTEVVMTGPTVEVFSGEYDGPGT